MVRGNRDSKCKSKEMFNKADIKKRLLKKATDRE